MKRTILSFCLSGAFFLLAGGCGKNNPPAAPGVKTPALAYSFSNYIGASTTNPMEDPVGVAVSGGNIWVANRIGCTFQDWTPGGLLLSSATSYNGTSFSGPTGVAIGPDGFIYVVDGLHELVAVFDPAGTWFKNFGIGTITNLSGEFIAVNATDVYVVDYTSPGEVFHFTISDSGAYKTYAPALTFGTSGTGTLGDFSTGVCLDAAGNVYVSDPFNSRVVKYNSTGIYQSAFAVSGTIMGLALDPSSGNIYAANNSNADFEVYNPSGVLQGSFGVGQISYPGESPSIQN